MKTQLVTQEIFVINHLDETTATISKSFRNSSTSVNVGETVLLNNQKDDIKVLAEVTDFDATWTASFKIIK